MAKVLESEFLPGRATKFKYPWDEWLDGQVWELTKGVDFDCKLSSLRATAWTQGCRRNKRVHTTLVNDNTLVIQAVEYKKEPASP